MTYTSWGPQLTLKQPVSATIQVLLWHKKALHWSEQACCDLHPLRFCCSAFQSGQWEKSFCSLWSQEELGCQANQQLSAIRSPTPIVTGNRNVPSFPRDGRTREDKAQCTRLRKSLTRLKERIWEIIGRTSIKWKAIQLSKYIPNQKEIEYNLTPVPLESAKEQGNNFRSLASVASYGYVIQSM